jgi:putative oxidoreductase
MMNKACMRKMFWSLKTWAPMPIRLALGVIFFAHGAQKLLGWFGGSGFQQTAEQFQSMGLHPGWLQAAMGGGGEMLGGILVFLGLFTRFGGFLISCTMVVAIVSVHLKNGLFASDGGFEYPLTCLAAAFSLILSGGGGMAIDNLMCSVERSITNGDESLVE